MKRNYHIIFLCMLFFALAACSNKTSASQVDQSSNTKAASASGKQVRIDIFYLPHPPAIAILRKVEAVLHNYPTAKINEYDFLDPKNADKIKAHGLTEHSPIVILLNDKNAFSIDGRQVEFKNFPKGDAFVPSLEGSWTYDDIDKAIASE
jgi:hypothetical protein